MVLSLSTEKYDDFYQQASSIVGLVAPFLFGMVVGYRASPQPCSLQLCFENMTTSRQAFLCLNATGSTGLHYTSSRSYHKNISQHQTNLSVAFKGSSDLTLHGIDKYGIISEKMKECIITATFAPQWLLLFYSKSVKSTLTNSAGPRGMQQKQV